MKQNITLSLDSQFLKSARVLAAERGTSVSKLLADRRPSWGLRMISIQKTFPRKCFLAAETEPKSGLEITPDKDYSDSLQGSG